MTESHDEVELFPILRGESVGEAGVFSGHVVIIESPEFLNREWKSDDIAVLPKSLEEHFNNNPGDYNKLFSDCAAVIAEFGESIGELAAVAYSSNAIAIVKVPDAVRVLENDMHIRITATENLGEIFFID